MGRITGNLVGSYYMGYYGCYVMYVTMGFKIASFPDPFETAWE